MSNDKTENALTKWQVKTTDGEYVIIECHAHSLDDYGRVSFLKDGEVVAFFTTFMYFTKMQYLTKKLIRNYPALF